MKLKLLHKTALSGLIALLIIGSFGQALSVTTYAFSWSPEVHIGFTSYNTHLQFNERTYIGNFSFVNGTHLSFNNILVNENVDSFIISAQNDNVTIITLSDSELFYDVDGAGGLQTIYLEGKTPTSVEIDGVDAVTGTNYFFEDGTAAFANAYNNVSITYSSDSDIALFSGISSQSGLIFLFFVCGLAALFIILIMRRD